MMVWYIKRGVTFYWFLFKHKDTPFLFKMVFVFAGIYVFSPIDILPDIILGVGFLDDILIAYLMMSGAGKMIPVKVIEECKLAVNCLFPDIIKK